MSNPSLILKDKVAIVTGAGRGLGEAIARAYAAEGATVIVSDIDGAAAQRVAGSLPGASAVERHGKLDIMVPNAGVAVVAPLATQSLEQWRAVTSVNLDGVFLCIRYAAPALIKNGGGTIVIMASVTAKAACALIGSYSASKAGAVSLAKTAAVELRAHNIRTNAILPSFIETELVISHKKEFEQQLGIPDFDAVIKQRQGRYGKESEVASLAVFLASERSSFCNGGA